MHDETSLPHSSSLILSRTTRNVVEQPSRLAQLRRGLRSLFNRRNDRHQPDVTFGQCRHDLRKPLACAMIQIVLREVHTLQLAGDS